LLPWIADAPHKRRSPSEVEALAVFGNRIFVGGAFNGLEG
jgi:hypothetical protein